MKVTNNLCLMGLNGVLEDAPLKEGVNEIIVPEQTYFEASILHLKEDISLKIILAGEASKCDIKIVYLCNKNNNYKINIDVIHEHKNTFSSQVVKGVLTDSARLVFDGIIRMPKDSQKCEGHQNHRAILLSEKASVKATPELEIYADDVKCSHGAAVGDLDRNHVYYLMTRGISEVESKKLLLKSYLADILPTKWAEHIDDWMDENV